MVMKKKLCHKKIVPSFLHGLRLRCKKWKDNLKKIMDLRNECEKNDKNGKKVWKLRKNGKGVSWNESMKDK
jgi:hypothetical protein